jgi:hypothetical protein
MSEVHLITFADYKFEGHRNLTNNVASFIKNKKDYKPEDIPEDFKAENAEIYYQPKGFGYWIWKPYIVLDYLTNHCEENDIVIYCDSGDYFHEDLVKQMVKNLESTYMTAIKSEYSQTAYTKRDCFVLMGCDEEKYWLSDQIFASMHFWKNNKDSRKFAAEWLEFCKNKFILTDEPNIYGKPNFPNYVDHRHDQSIFTNLMIKHNLPTRVYKHAVNPWSI